MADKVVNGIGRELRYFEYKFRKKQQSGKKHKKDKNGNMAQQELAWSDTSPANEEFKKAMPGSKGEEALQVEVALAMSREENQEQERQAESDKIRLEMAIKESLKQAEIAKKTEEVKSQPSLLDLSMGAQRSTAPSADLFQTSAPAAATNDPWSSNASSSSTFDPFSGQPYPTTVAQASNPNVVAASNDPWSTGAQMPGSSQASAPVSFDPFSSQQTLATQSASANSNAMSATSGNLGNAWGSAQQPAAPQTQNPWGATMTPQQPTSISTPQVDPWGASTSVTPQNNTQLSNAWGNTAPLAGTQIMAPQNDAWGNASTPAMQQPMTSQNGAWGNSNLFGSAPNPPQQQANFDPFTGGMSSAQSNMFSTSAAPVSASQTQSVNPFGMQGGESFAPPPFDPLKDFDNLHIRSNEPEPVVLSQDFASGKSVAQDLFSGNALVTPQNTNGVPVSQPAVKSSERHNSFLGENSSLVNLDSGWKTYQVPYCTKPLGTTTQNPFQPTGPTKTLNEMMSSGKQPGFP